MLQRLARLSLGCVRRGVGLVALFFGAAPALAQPPLPQRPWLESPVLQLAVALRGQGAAAVARLPQVRGLQGLLRRPIVRDDALLLELIADQRPDAAAWHTWAARSGVEPLAAGRDVWLAWVPLAALEQLGRWPGLARARLPLPLRGRLGPTVSAGATLSGATARHCHGQRGAGARVAVVDEEWSGFSQALGQGELGDIEGKAPYQGSDPQAWHGTACAEIVADMAPAAAIRPLQLATLAELQVQLPKLQAAGVQIVSQSSGWTSGYSFGDGSGKACALVQAARQAGIAWVAAAGNEGGGHQWRGVFSDSDQDGWLEFASGDESNGFYAQGGTLVALELDWNAYPATAIDLDLHLCSNASGPCQTLATSQGLQSGSQSPIEAIWWDVPQSGSYFLRVHAKQGVAAGLALRLVGQGTGPLQHAQAAGSVVDPAACADALAVGAADAATWGSGAIADYSAQGPTFDGRIKPDLLAPTAVQVSVADELFEGTSAAAPHVAGALAVLLGQGLGVEPALAALRDQADARGLALPDSQRGYGWLRLSGPSTACLPEQTVPAACTSACGSPGQVVCADPCASLSCAPLGDPCPTSADAGDAGSAPGAEDAAAQQADSDSVGTGSATAPAPPPSRGCHTGASPGAVGWGWTLVAAWLWARRYGRSASHQPAAPPAKQTVRVTAA